MKHDFHKGHQCLVHDPSCLKCKICHQWIMWNERKGTCLGPEYGPDVPLGFAEGKTLHTDGRTESFMFRVS
jgi:hypothetical protein